MWCKEDLVSWFKNLESYKRIDVMCTLLNLCLPFELRFLGTCLEELGRRDAQILRGVELRVNNPQEFVTDIGSFQSGQPTDMKIRRMMALYLALMRACNRTCVNELFKTLDGWGDRDFTKFSDGDPLQELLLVYTMATNHPVFSFEQRLKCGDIFSKITDSKPYLKENQQQSPPPASPITSPLSTFHIIQPIANPSNSPPPPPFQTAPALIQQQQPMLNPQPITNPILMGFPQPSMMIPVTADPLSQAPLNAESLNQMQVPPTMVIPPDFSIPPPWLIQSRFNHPLYSTVPIDTMAQFPPQASSPHMSQPSSPAHSRTGSPTRQQIQQMMPTATSQSIRNNQNRSMRLNRRPSTDTTPPPLLQQQQQQQQQQSSGGQQQQSSHQPSVATTANFMSNEMLNNQHMVKNFDELNVDDAIIQFQNLRNGYARSTMPLRQPNTKTYAHHMQQIHHQQQHHQQQQQMSQSGFNPNLTPFMQNLSLEMQPQMVATGTQQKAIDSESGSSIGSVSPPPQQQQQQQLESGGMGNNNSGNNGSLRNPLTLSRLNGRNTENYAQHNSNSIGNMVQHHQLTTNAVTTAVIVGTNTNIDFNGALPANSNIVFIAPQQLQQQQQQQHAILIHNPQFNNNNNNRTVAASTSFRNIPGPANGEMLYPYKIPLTSAAFLSSSSSTSSSSLKSQSIITTNTQQQQSQQLSPSEQNPPPPQAPQAVLLQATPYPMSKYHVQSCFNCGSTNHIGLNCQEVSMEDVTRNATYKLDYTVSTQPHTTTTPQQLTTATSVSTSTSTPPQSMTNSSSNDPQLAPTSLPMSNNNFDDSLCTTEAILESQNPIIIDLTQDTSSSSSSTCSSTK